MIAWFLWSAWFSGFVITRIETLPEERERKGLSWIPPEEKKTTHQLLNWVPNQYEEVHGKQSSYIKIL